MSRLRRHLPLPLRLLMLVVLLLGTAGGALASALGDLHALSHADVTGQAHAASHASTPDAASDDDADANHDEDDNGTRLLHALVHCGQCHGHGGVLPLASPAWSLPAAPAHGVPTALTAQLLAQPPESLLRPPIAV
ncbi:CopL family metal-binding regulatory protein [uncultured Stenotrophomonas sp.]|uniref:CopL family metal-binding regulatory protein n=1 Tax=uncultured Stenotrophomonas sp. TaxID=165438 RepID=UPI0028EA6A0E|nr:CopL family metal-binding regulatory protein [uncultured Stenotrophomonas sp.]